MLSDLCGSYRREINLICAVAQENIAAEMAKSMNQPLSPIDIARWKQVLMDNCGLDATASNTAVMY
jgi:hypothetical protein